MAVIDQIFTSPAMRAVIQERDDALPWGVSVCIPYHNERPELLERAVSSVHEQTLQPREIIVVDDGSRHPFEPTNFPFLDHPLIRTVRVTNRGLPAARNTGLMLAKGVGFLPLDADDWLEPTFIEKTYPVFHEEDADVVFVGLQEHGPTRKSSYLPGYDRPAEEVTEQVLWQMNRFFYCSLIRSDVLREVGGYHTRMAGWPGIVNGGYEDWDLWITLKRRGAKFSVVNEVLFNYNTDNGPNSMLARAEQHRAQLVQEMRRHHQLD